MPALDIYHKPFCKALKKDGWKITQRSNACLMGR